LTLLSRLLIVATAAVWVRSYYANDWLGRIHYAPNVPNEDHHVWLKANRGTFHLIGGGDPIENFSQVRWEWQHNLVYPDIGVWGIDGPSYLRRIGISWEKQIRVTTGEYWWTFSLRISTSPTPP
jgi:hypothetical protein